MTENAFETIRKTDCSHGRKKKNDIKENLEPDKRASISMVYKAKTKCLRILKYVNNVEKRHYNLTIKKPAFRLQRNI